MFKKLMLKRKIKGCRNKITMIEKKRSRSQAALVDAILKHTEPNEQDVEYFNEFTSQIEETRNEMHRLQAELEAMQ